MSEKQARKRRRQLRQGNPSPRAISGDKPSPSTPQHNHTDLPDTREQRRLKKFRPKAYALAQRQASIREHMVFVNKWNKVFHARKDNTTHNNNPKPSLATQAETAADLEPAA